MNDPSPAGFSTSMRRPVGSSQIGMRQFNERIVLQTIRRHGALPKAEVARLTRLSSQTASVLINALLADGLVIKQNRVRGRVGQPSVPITLSPDGAFTLGIKVGRRSLGVLAMDFVGQVRYRELLEYDFPDPEIIFPAIARKLELVDAQLGAHSQRLVGAGVAAPLWLGGWGEFLGAPSGVMDAWKQISIRDRIQAMTPLRVEFAKDTTAACAAELVVGQGRSLRNFLYLFIGTFIGGGLVLDGRLHTGPHGNAGAAGSLPLPSSQQEPRSQLLHKASGLVLEQSLKKLGLPVAAAHDARAVSPQFRPATARWLDRRLARAGSDGDLGSRSAGPRRRGDRRRARAQSDRGNRATNRCAPVGELQLGRHVSPAACCRAASARTRARWAVRSCRCTPTSRRITNWF